MIAGFKHEVARTDHHCSKPICRGFTTMFIKSMICCTARRHNAIPIAGHSAKPAAYVLEEVSFVRYY